MHCGQAATPEEAQHGSANRAGKGRTRPLQSCSDRNLNNGLGTHAGMIRREASDSSRPSGRDYFLLRRAARTPNNPRQIMAKVAGSGTSLLAKSSMARITSPFALLANKAEPPATAPA